MTDRVDYDEFGLFHENAAEYGLPFDRPPAVRRTFAEVAPGRRLSALVWQDRDPELVLLHGGSQNAHTWDTVAMALDRPLVAIDLPGHGHSDGPGDSPEGQLDVYGNAVDVAAAIRQLAPAAQAVVGMSLGGLTAIALTAEAPELVRKLVLVDVLPGIKAQRAQHITDFVTGPPSFASLDELLERTARFNPSRSRSSLRRGILHNAEQQSDGTWVWRWARHRRPEPPVAPAAAASTVAAAPVAPAPAAAAPAARQPVPATGSSGKRCRRSPCRCCSPAACGRTRFWTTTTSGNCSAVCLPPRSFTSRKPATACRATRPLSSPRSSSTSSSAPDACLARREPPDTPHIRTNMPPAGGRLRYRPVTRLPPCGCRVVARPGSPHPGRAFSFSRRERAGSERTGRLRRESAVRTGRAPVAGRARAPGLAHRRGIGGPARARRRYREYG